MFRLIKLIIWIIVIFSGIIYYNYSNFDEKIIVKEDKNINVQSGANIKTISNELGVSYFYMKKHIEKNYPDFTLQVGEYELKKDSNLELLISSLQNPITNEISITFLEGWNIFDIDDYLSNLGLISKGEYISYVENSEKIKALTEFFPFIEGLNTLEGFLYPDTYKIDKSKFAINRLVITQLENFENKVYNKSLSSYSLDTIKDVITLASIVEKEANQNNSPQELAIVAGILKKRLNENWLIGADATVCYPHRITHKECSPYFVSTHILDDNKYNLRKYIGLTPTPISNPSFKTINATINDIETKYYFYLHDNSGNIHYAVTNREHEINKSKYLR